MTPDAELLDELGANVLAVHCGLQGMLALIGDSPALHAVPADGLRQLLLPLADQAQQASAAAGLLAANAVCMGDTPHAGPHPKG